MSISHSFVGRLFEFHNNVKLFHFQTKSYAAHKVSDELFAQWSELYDRFLEVLQGKLGKRISTIHNCHTRVHTFTTVDMKKYTRLFIKYLKRYHKRYMRYTELTNILDEMIASLERFLYLLSFS